MKGGSNFESANQKICAIHSAKLLNTLTADATVSCSKCGARAHDPASLCAPVQIPGSG